MADLLLSRASLGDIAEELGQRDTDEPFLLLTGDDLLVGRSVERSELVALAKLLLRMASTEAVAEMRR